MVEMNGLMFVVTAGKIALPAAMEILRSPEALHIKLKLLFLVFYE